jgi:predicted RNase H-like HicB family nuclease
MEENKQGYPAIFRFSEDGWYCVEFVDFGWVTEGSTLEEAYKMAGDLLLLYYDEPEANRVRPSKIEDVKVTGDEKVLMVYPKYFNINDPTEKNPS